MKDDIPTEADRDRFLALVERGGPHACWPYRGRWPFAASFGQVSPLAFAWRLGTGRPFPFDEVAYHRCGRPWCANPRHITTADPQTAGRERERIKREGPTCRVEVAPERETPTLTRLAPAVARRSLPPGACSYCGSERGGGSASACGARIACPVCSAPGWAELVATYGPASA